MTLSQEERIDLRLIAFDMDGTLLDGRVIYAVGKYLGILPKIQRIMESPSIPYVKSKRIARMLTGLMASDFKRIVSDMDLSKGATQVTMELKGRGYKVGIISDSYTLATSLVARRLKLDFHMANELEVVNGVISGVLKMPLGWERIGCECRQSVCKRYQLIRLADRCGVARSNTMAVGDSESDRCMIEYAGIGVWFNRRGEPAWRGSIHFLPSKDLTPILSIPLDDKDDKSSR